MQNNVIAARAIAHAFDDEAALASAESVTLFSLLGLVASATVLLTSSSQAVTVITAALM